MDPAQIERNNERIKRKRENEGINRRIETLVKRAHKLGGVDGVDVALIISKHGRYTTYRSRDHKTWPPPMAEIVSGSSPDLFLALILI
jgi:hypothetical protein